ncbi:MAG: hypothetical protein EOL95_07735 [Bacteroidia bacterium]|nr:hypothetical protein [Bacteroidia bacterium]
MKDRIKLLCVSVFFVGICFATIYDKFWNEVEVYEQGGLPVSAKNTIDSIYTIAQKEQNYPQLIKSMVYQLKEDMSIDEDSFFVHLNQFKVFAKDCPDKVASSVAYSIMAELMQSYYYADSFKIDARNQVAVNLEDITEWTSEMYKNVIIDWTKKSIEAKTALTSTDIDIYNPIINSGKDSLLRSNMYDVLAYRAVSRYGNSKSDSLEIVKIYDSIIKLNANNREAAAYAESQKAVYLGQSFDNILNRYSDTQISVYLTYLKCLKLPNKQAHEICLQTIKSYPNNKYNSSLRHLLSSIERPELSVNMNALAYPGDSIKLKCSYVNINEVHCNIYRLNISATDALKYRYKNIPDSLKELIDTVSYSLSKTDDYETEKVSLMLKGLDPGYYGIDLIADTCKSKPLSFNMLAVSRFMLFKKQDGTNLSCYVTDRKTGKYIKNVSVDIYKAGKIKHTYKTNSIGIVETNLPKSTNYYIGLSMGKDIYYPLDDIYTYERSKDNSSDTQTQFLLDRKVFRPGQILYFKGISGIADTAQFSLQINKSIHVVLRDANYKIINESDFITNDFGSFSGSFKLPSNAMQGAYYIQTNNGSETFRVESYKRPTFDVKIEQTKAAYTFGDTISIKGSAMYYAGYPLRKANVKYKLVRQVMSFRIFYPMLSRQETIEIGSTQIDENGMFNIKAAIGGYNNDDFIDESYLCNFYRYVIYVDVTDDAGETQSEEYSISIGKKSMYLNIDIPQFVNKSSQTTFTVYAKSLDGKEISVNGNYEVLKDAQVIKKGDLVGGKSVIIKDLSKLVSGKYLLKVSCFDKNGKTISDEKSFVVFGEKDKKPAVDTVMWFMPLNKSCKVGEKFKFVLGSSEKTYILCEVYDAQKLLMRKIIYVDNRNKTVTMPYKNKYGDNLSIRVMSVKNGSVYKDETNMNKEQIDNSISISVESFRDKLEPGDKESWTIRVKDAQGKAIESEVLADMYDLSLDAFASNNWALNMHKKSELSAPMWLPNITGDFSNGRSYKYDSNNLYEFEFPELIHLWKPMYMYSYFDRKTRAMGVASDMAESNINMNEPILAKAVEETVSVKDQNIDSKSDAIRTDFAETAFFYPHLRTDSTGSVLLKFSAPEALTTWKLMLAAHTKDAKYSIFADTVVTQKQVSLHANVPRFVRVDDNISIPVRVENLTGLKGTIKLHWIVSNIMGSEIVAEGDDNIVTDGNKSVMCSFKVPEKTDLITFQVVASLSNHSDGEKHYLPVLQKQVLVTESMMMDAYNQGNQTFVFESLAKNTSKTINNKNLIVEFSPNAAWYALQAIPYLTEPKYPNSIDLAAAYYSDVKAKMLLDSLPGLREYLIQKKSKGENISSALNKNEGLKDILLSETPWLADAENESTQLNSLTELLDNNNWQYRVDNIYEKLTALQLPSGAFTWFNGGSESLFATLFVAEQLNAINPNDNALANAKLWLNAQLKKNFNEKSKVDLTDLRTMYICGSDTSKVFNFYYNQAIKNWAFYGIYEKALCAWIFYDKGNFNETQKVLLSLREYAAKKKGLGMYWTKNKSIETHAFILKTFAKFAPKYSELEDMKVWLLNNKKTHIWDQTIATTNAIDALINSGSKDLSNESSLQVIIGKQKIEPQQELGTGYFSHTIQGNDITTDDAVITVNKETKSYAYGSAFWQYTEDIDKIKSNKNSILFVDRKLYVEKNGILKPIDSSNVKVGDRICVRITLKTDRDIEFVHLKDLRAAGTEPQKQMSEYVWNRGLSYYKVVKDASVEMFFTNLRKGTYVLEYDLWASLPGKYQAGYASVQCLYSPDLRANSSSLNFTILP